MRDRRFKHCPVCGHTLSVRELEGLPRRVCSDPACGFVFYANSKPCAGALVEHEGRLLLVRRMHAPFAGWWDVPGGFLEAGEHPEAGAIREVFEETGLRVTLAGLVGLYMDVYQPRPEDEPVHSLNVFYGARPAPGANPEALRADAAESAEVRWFPVEALPPLAEIAFANGRAAVRDWLAGRAAEAPPG